MSTSFEKKVWNACKRIPKGKISTYSEIAKIIGNKNSARAVGNALNKNPYKNVPCHRVVKSSGEIGGFARGKKEKVKLLRKEGIRIENNRILDFRNIIYTF